MVHLELLVPKVETDDESELWVLDAGGVKVLENV